MSDDIFCLEPLFGQFLRMDSLETRLSSLFQPSRVLYLLLPIVFLFLYRFSNILHFGSKFLLPELLQEVLEQMRQEVPFHQKIEKQKVPLLLLYFVLLLSEHMWDAIQLRLRMRCCKIIEKPVCPVSFLSFTLRFINHLLTVSVFISNLRARSSFNYKKLIFLRDRLNLSCRINIFLEICLQFSKLFIRQTLPFYFISASILFSKIVIAFIDLKTQKLYPRVSSCPFCTIGD